MLGLKMCTTVVRETILWDLVDISFERRVETLTIVRTLSKIMKLSYHLLLSWYVFIVTTKLLLALREREIENFSFLSLFRSVPNVTFFVYNFW